MVQCKLKMIERFGTFITRIPFLKHFQYPTLYACPELCIYFVVTAFSPIALPGQNPRLSFECSFPIFTCEVERSLPRFEDVTYRSNVFKAFETPG